MTEYKPAIAPISSPDKLQFAYPAAVGYLSIMSRFAAKGANAIYLSRLKNAIAAGVEEFEKARKDVMHDHAKLKPAAEGAEPEMEIDAAGQVQFPDPTAAKACRDALGKLTDELPIVVDVKHPNLRKAAEKALKILTSDDCPPIHNDDWAHERIVAEFELALGQEPKA